MDTKTAIGSITQALNTLQPQVDALNVALKVLQDGVQSDMDIARKEVQASFAAIEKTKEDEKSQLVAVIDDLTTRAETAEASLLEAQAALTVETEAHVAAQATIVQLQAANAVFVAAQLAPLTDTPTDITV